ncbi:hypothetical protein [Haloferula rosea]|uniref:Glycine zipper domain-containing protein n=1 Tax=Haloferula rosea TaxID=490093 RepID=A0A934RET5_9BACT|nr:hypothetical protein [Haloferula rosea]MBK1827874.1 hypothetical protein [Haloferula rosea]
MNVKQYAALGLAIMGMASCTTYQQQAGLIGGVAGAAAGAAFGDDSQDVIAGAAAGAALGAGAAAVHENHVRKRDYARYGIPAPEDNPPAGGSGGAPPPPKQESTEYPVAQRTSDPNEVLSPYPPHHRINVEGFKSGQLARDPKNQKIFRIP